MIKVEKIETWGFEHAVRGMRNPYDSWAKSDSDYDVQYYDDKGEETEYHPIDVGENDLSLMRSLYKGGPEHRKYLRQIFVSMDITAPLYWWKEMDKYQIGVTTNSCSTMHTIHKKDFTVDDFSHEHLNKDSLTTLQHVINTLNVYRKQYVESKEKDMWWQLIQLLPSSYNQKRTITMNYEKVVSIIRQRTGHRLTEWHDLINVLKGLPLIEEITKE